MLVTAVKRHAKMHDAAVQSLVMLVWQFGPTHALGNSSEYRQQDTQALALHGKTMRSHMHRPPYAILVIGLQHVC